MYIDSHTHFDLILKNTGLTEDQIINMLNSQNIGCSVQVSVDTDTFEWSDHFSQKHEKHGILFSVGIHPTYLADEPELNKLKNFLDNYFQQDHSQRLFGIGECGLDYYRLYQPKEMQLQSFTQQIELAQQYDLPIIIHSRDAMEDTIALLRKYAPLKGIMHCFPGNTREAQNALDLGLFISFAGNVTFKKAVTLQESARYIPLDRILLETDAPYLSPVPMRGKKNIPEYIIHTYDFIAELRDMSIEELQNAIHKNFNTLRQQ